MISAAFGLKEESSGGKRHILELCCLLSYNRGVQNILQKGSDLQRYRCVRYRTFNVREYETIKELDERFRLFWRSNDQN